MVRWTVGDTERRPPGAAVAKRLVRSRLRRPVTARVLRLPVNSRPRRIFVGSFMRLAGYGFNHGDVTLSVAYHAADAEVVTPLLGVDATVVRGPDGAREMWAQWSLMWQDMRRDVLEVAETADRMLVLCRQTGRGRDGIELSQGVALLFTWRDGWVTRHQEFTSFDDGFRALAGP